MPEFRIEIERVGNLIERGLNVIQFGLESVVHLQQLLRSLMEVFEQGA